MCITVYTCAYISIYTYTYVCIPIPKEKTVSRSRSVKFSLMAFGHLTLSLKKPAPMQQRKFAEVFVGGLTKLSGILPCHFQ